MRRRQRLAWTWHDDHDDHDDHDFDVRAPARPTGCAALKGAGHKEKLSAPCSRPVATIEVAHYYAN
jgi:hypothetical protein